MPITPSRGGFRPENGGFRPENGTSGEVRIHRSTEPNRVANRCGHLPANESGPGASDGRAILEAVEFTRCHGGR